MGKLYYATTDNVGLNISQLRFDEPRVVTNEKTGERTYLISMEGMEPAHGNGQLSLSESEYKALCSALPKLVAVKPK